MKIHSASFLAAIVASHQATMVSGFSVVVPATAAPRTDSTLLRALTPLNAEGSSTTSRKDFLTQSLLGAVVGPLLVGGSFPAPAVAAKYGSFGAGSPEVLDPNDAEINQDILKSDAVQSALKKVQGYQGTVRSMQDALSKDSQVNVGKTIVKEFDFAKLRETLYVVDTAFEEDTQRGTDRLIRAIMQDITELEMANQQKDGIPRSPRRVETMNNKLTKLDQAFTDFLAFAK